MNITTVSFPELLAPAGNFMSGYYAFEAGADAVYLGLKKFSARERAQNFSTTELLKLKALAVKNNKKIYVTLNTIISESEFDELIETIYFLEHIQIDAVLVQDFGLLYLLKKHFPDLRVHASTQMAIHTPDGIRTAQDLGICRIVLPREVDSETIHAFSGQFPDMEFEVFIHGAVCYSFSGVCLASGLLYGRSGNRGECAQLCRGRYSGKNMKKYPFACRDLVSGIQVRKLAACGVKSLKIEGRLKQPNYVYHVVRYYRYILDTQDVHSDTLTTLENNVRYVFSRENTAGKLFRAPPDSLIVNKYQRHMGMRIGHVVSSDDKGFIVKSNVPVENQDVIAVYLNDHEELPYKIPLHHTDEYRTQVYKTTQCYKITVFSDKIPERGQDVYKLYARNCELPGIRHDPFSEYRTPIQCDILLKSDTQTAVLECIFEIDEKRYSRSFPLNVRERVKIEKLEKRMKEASRRTASGTCILEPILNNTDCEEDRDTIENISRTQLEGIFRLLYGEVQKIYDESVFTRKELIKTERKMWNSEELSKELSAFISDRKRLSPYNSKTTFAGSITRFDELAGFINIKFIPLPPVLLNEKTITNILELVTIHSDTNFYIGINNIGHFNLIQMLAGQDNIRFFTDYFFYIANSFTIQFLIEFSSDLQFGYFWIEGDKSAYTQLREVDRFPLIFVNNSFHPPLFVRAGNFIRESMKADHSMDDGGLECSGEGRIFDIVIEDETSYFFCRDHKK